MEVRVERKNTDGSTISETYEDVDDVINPPPTDHIHLKRDDGEDDKTVGEIVRVQ